MNELEAQAQKLLHVLQTGDTSKLRPTIPEKVLEQHIAILGITGSGKTYTSKGIVETLLAEKRRVCILDPAGVWWGLRSDTTGRRPAFEVYIFGGDHGDFPLDYRSGAAIAELIGTSDISAILDNRNFTIEQRTIFLADFGETLLRLNRNPLNLIIDEAHLMMPQSVHDRKAARMLDAGNNMVSLGRGVGLRITMITQRAAKLHKDSMTQAQTLIAMRLIAPHDIRAAESWIGEWASPQLGKEMISSLPSLPTGEGWIWAPEIGILECVRFARITTYDSSKAPTGTAPRSVVMAEVDASWIELPEPTIEDEPESEWQNRIEELEVRVAALEGQRTLSSKPDSNEATNSGEANT
jgi:uncharacterized protein